MIGFSISYRPIMFLQDWSVGWIWSCCFVTQLCLTLCNPTDSSMPGFPVLHYLLECAQTRVHWVGDAVQLSHLLSPTSPSLNLSQHRGLFQWVGSSYQVAKVLELQLQSSALPVNIQGWLLLDWMVWSPCCPRDSEESSATPQFKSINS